MNARARVVILAFLAGMLFARDATAAAAAARGRDSTAVRRAPASRMVSRAPAPVLAATDPLSSDPVRGAPHHGDAESFAFGGHAQIRAADDRVAGISNPDWVSIPRLNAFAVGRVHPRVRLAAEATYDRATDDLVVERLLVDARMGARWSAHGGVLQPPLGRVNFDHDAPKSEFENLSYVATDLVGVPNPQLGLGVHGVRDRGRGAPWTWELDAVTGYDEGVITEASLGTRLPMGRNTFGTGSSSWAFAGRLAVHPAEETEFGFALLGGAYDPLQMDGVTVDPSRMLGLSVVDARGAWRGFRLALEAGAAWVNVPGGLEGLYAERQWAVSAEASRTLREPAFRAWPGTAVVAALRADAIDQDAQLAGDSKTRLSASLNFRQKPRSVLRSGWYYEWRRDRFDNLKPAAGLVFSLATYF